MINKILERIPYLRYAYWYRKNSSNRPGHFYSSVLDIDYIKANEHKLWPDRENVVKGINLNTEKQIELLKNLKPVYDKLKLDQFESENGNRYIFNKTWFGYSDATLLYMILMAYKPKNIIEIGSGFSSALMLDINGQEFDNKINLTFIDPNPEDRLNSLIKDADRKTATIIKGFIQDVDTSVFDKLSANDILFVDNSHVSKTGSDVNHTFFEIFPRLKKGTLIHIHDIFNGFMYPKEWIFDTKVNWNEIFLCRAFLMYNQSFEILLFPDYLKDHSPEIFDDFPYLKKSRPQSLWLRKID